ncbi:MAG: hypothetical protein Q9201_005143 [Fulgogasparrea decipioides]
MSVFTDFFIMTAATSTCTRGLASRKSNTCPRFASTMSPPWSAQEQPPYSISRRDVRQSTLPKVSDLERRRRQQFLRKVRQKGHDRKWDARGEQVSISKICAKPPKLSLSRYQMLREDFLASERLWLEQQDRSAPTLPAFPSDEDIEEVETNIQAQASGMVDQVLAQEDAEVEALVSMFEDQSNEGSLATDESANYGSEEESYDLIFMDILSTPSVGESSRHDERQVSTNNHQEAHGNEEMDTTRG